MNDMNLCVFTGRLGQDPDCREVNGVKYANFTIAVSNQWKDKQTGEKKEATEWVQCSARQHQATYIEKYLKKGDKVLIEGKWHTQKWQDAKGEDRKSVSIKVSSVQGLGSRSNTSDPVKPERTPPDDNEYDPSMDDEIPF